MFKFHDWIDKNKIDYTSLIFNKRVNNFLYKKQNLIDLFFNNDVIEILNKNIYYNEKKIY
jgi:hypothetical protein